MTTINNDDADCSQTMDRSTAAASPSRDAAKEDRAENVDDEESSVPNVASDQSRSSGDSDGRNKICNDASSDEREEERKTSTDDVDMDVAIDNTIACDNIAVVSESNSTAGESPASAVGRNDDGDTVAIGQCEQTIDADGNVVDYPRTQAFDADSGVDAQEVAAAQLLSRHKQIEFDPDRHVYRFNGEYYYNSVSKLAGVLFPKFDANDVVDRMVSSKGWKRSSYYKMCGVGRDGRDLSSADARESILREWKNRRDNGTLYHSVLEDLINGKGEEDERETAAKRLPEHDPRHAKLVECYKKICKYFSRLNLEPLQTECRLVDQRKKIAGTTDLLLTDHRGEIVVVDWKFCQIKFDVPYTSSNVAKPVDSPLNHYPDTNYWKYSAQLNIYKIILEREYNLKVSNMYMVGIDQVDFEPTFYNVPIFDILDDWYERRDDEKNEIPDSPPPEKRFKTDTDV